MIQFLIVNYVFFSAFLALYLNAKLVTVILKFEIDKSQNLKANPPPPSARSLFQNGSNSTFCATN